MSRRFIAFTTSCIPFLAFLSGCAVTPSPEIEAKRAELTRTTPICIGEKDCHAKWDAAQLWITHHAGYKLQTATNVVLETYNATNSSIALAVRVTKEPIGEGKYAIRVATWCDNIFGCSPNQWDAALDFNRTVAAASP